MAEYSINAKVSGVLRHTTFLDKWKQHPDVLYARPLVQVMSRGLQLVFAAVIKHTCWHLHSFAAWAFPAC